MHQNVFDARENHRKPTPETLAGTLKQEIPCIKDSFTESELALLNLDLPMYPPPIPRKPILSRLHNTFTPHSNIFRMTYTHDSQLRPPIPILVKLESSFEINSPEHPHRRFTSLEKRTETRSLVRRKNIRLSLSYLPPVPRVSVSIGKSSSHPRNTISQGHISNITLNIFDTIKELIIERDTKINRS